MSDKLKFILSASADFYGVAPIRNDATVREFLDNDDTSLLMAYRNETADSIAFSLQLQSDVTDSLLFYKISTAVRKEANSRIGVLSIDGGIVTTIYNSLSRVFSPKISVKQRALYSSEVATLLEQLQERISTSLGLPGTGTLTIGDEIEHWRRVHQMATTRSDKDKTIAFVDWLKEINDQLMAMNEQNSLNFLEESIDRLHHHLDEMWKSNYHFPQNRMKDILDILAMHVVECCADQLSTEDLWSSANSRSINASMLQVHDILDNWNQVCDSLTRLFWPNYGQHAWLGDPHIPKVGHLLKSRITEISNIKTLHSQLVNLFEDDGNLVRMLNQIFRPFRKVNILDVQALGIRKWATAVDEFERIMKPIDEKIAVILKAKLANFTNNPRQMMLIFINYNIIAQRPSVLAFLRAERDLFIESLKHLTADLQRSLTDNSGSFYNDTHLSAICWECRWLKTCQKQIEEIVDMAKVLQINQSEVDIFKDLHDLLAEVKTEGMRNFEKWCEESTLGTQSDTLSLRDDKLVVEFERNEKQLMRVTFNPQLIKFCYDCREFEMQGFHVPMHLKNTAAHATKFIGHARLLQQVAAFHNTIGDRMIPCQRPIMLKNAIELANTVKSESVPWSDEDSVKRYVLTLQNAVNKLSKDNGVLVNYHEQIKAIVVRLMSIDLLRQNQLWKEQMRNIREINASLERNGYTNLLAFKLHWDHQLYKVLEYQYISGLLSLDHKLPDINIEIVFRQSQLQFRPPVEEIRAKYFYHIRRFLERPLGFRGLSDQSATLFESIVERNRHHFEHLYNHARELFTELENYKNKWLHWVSMGSLDLEEFCKLHLKEWEDWDRNFRECKQFGQQIAKIQSVEERIQCFVIDINPLKADIEFLSRRFWDALTNSLRSSIIDNVTVLDDFVRPSLQTLQSVTNDSAGIAECSAKYERIKTEMPRMEALLKSLQGKDTCLAGWCKERVSTLSAIESRWEQLQPLIENHHAVLQRHIDLIKDQTIVQLTNLGEESEKFLIRWEATIKDIETNDDADFNTYRDRKQQWAAIVEKRSALQSECTKYNIPIPSTLTEAFEHIQSAMAASGRQWDLYETFMAQLEAVSGEEWLVYRRRPYNFNEFIAKWKKEALLSTVSVATTKIRKQLDMFTSLLPTLQAMQSDALAEKHWAKIFSLMGEPAKSYQDVILKDLLKTSLVQHNSEIQELVKQATSDFIVKQALSELEQWGVVAALNIISATDSKGSPISLIKDYQDVLNKIGDNKCLLQSSKNSSAFDTFVDQADIWEQRLNSLEGILASLNKIQRKWIYLEPVFDSKTIRNEDTTFIRIDKDFRYLMREIAQDPRVLSVLRITNISNIIHGMESQLLKCQNVLSNFIQEKRNSFPRFYFLNDDDLLELLGQSNKDNVLQRHIKKLFPAISNLKTAESIENQKLVVGIQNSDGDVMKFNSPVSTDDTAIEDWLAGLDSQIKETLRALLRTCLSHFKLDLETLDHYPMQILCLCKAILFTREAEKAITSMNVQVQLTQVLSEITQLTDLIPKCDSLPSANSVKQKVRALLVDLVHYVDILRMLKQKRVTSTQDWYWLKQLRFYSNVGSAKGGRVHVKMVYAEFDYSFEYLGNFPRLVNTKLTQKCYLTLTQAMQLGLGGNPFGPAGTGKTECVKSLGALLGRLVLVFNCNENIDSQSIGLILIGLARSGAWGCFDEFNRLQEQTLSAISMHIQALQSAVKSRAESVTLLAQTIPVNLYCGVFVTLNPAGEEYGGRQKLPGNIQNLFRPIVMQQPEPMEISKVLLFVEGFQHTDFLSQRVVELFELCSKMLSPQRFYDWGLRELKTVLTACGNSLRAIKSQDHGQDKHCDESNIVVAVLRSNIMSKLTMSDRDIFNLLMKIIFPSEMRAAYSRELAGDGTQSVMGAIESSFSSLGLISNAKQIGKCVDLYEQLMKRMGVVVIGEPGTGKTTLIKVLKQALINTGRQIRTYTITPKSMPIANFLGKLDPDTRQWQDGILTSTAVAVTSEESQISSWIICDGDVDPEWIEALNSVLDDNKLLTLPSGWRIQFGDNVNFIFETHDLQHASPATISRMGIVNVNREDFPETVLLERFYVSLSMDEQIQGIYKSFIENYLYRAIDRLLQWVKAQQYFQISRASCIKYVTDAINNQLLLNQVDGGPKLVLSKEQFGLVLVHSLASVLPFEEKGEYINTMLYEWMELSQIPANTAQLNYIKYDKNREALDVYSYDDYISKRASCSGDVDGKLLIKTPLICSYLDVLQCLMVDNSPFLIVGPSGSGKSLLIEEATASAAGAQLITIHCSAQLNSSYILYVLQENFLVASGVRGRELKPRMKKAVLFLKNINLLQTDKYGTSDVIELLQQVIQRRGFYSESLDWVSVSGLQICGSITMLGSETCKLSARFLGLNKFITVSYPLDEDLIRIVTAQLDELSLKVRPKMSIKDILSTFKAVQARFTGDDSPAHYKFTPKMISRIIENLRYYREENLTEALVYEMRQVLGNRLSTKADTESFDEILSCVGSTGPANTTEYFVPALGHEKVSLIAREEFLEMVKKNVGICNNEDVQINCPIDDLLLSQTASVIRAISRPETHLVVIGTVGCGHTESIHIAAAGWQVKLFTIQAVRHYSKNDFYNDLKAAMLSAALDNQNTVLLIDFTWLAAIEGIAIPIEAILEHSDIPELFGEELESVAAPLKNDAQADNYTDSISSYFMKRVRQNLHLIILLERDESLFINDLFEKYPALYRNTEVLWMHKCEISHFNDLTNSYCSIIQNDVLNASLPQYAARVIPTLPKWNISPYRLAHFIKCYMNIFYKMSTKIKTRCDMLKKGVEKLSENRNVVDALREQAKEQEEALSKKRKMAEQSLELISSTMRNASDQKTDLLELKKSAQVSNEKLQERKKAIELELTEVEPLLREASSAVGQIKSEALSEIRSLRAPPEVIRDILEGVLRIMGIRDTSWNSMKTFLAKRGVKEDIRSLDPARITAENCAAVQKLLKTKADSFDSKNAKRASVAAAPLAAWVIANVEFSKVMQSIKPLEREQNELQKSLIKAEAEMKALSSGLDDVDARVKELSAQLNVYTQEAAVLAIKLEEVQTTLKSAEILVSKLSAEYETWNQEYETLCDDLKSLDDKAFLMSLTIVYLSGLILDDKQNMLLNINRIVPDLNMNFSFVTDQDKIQWEGYGLTPDRQSMENAGIINEMLQLPYGASPIPCLLDPTGNAYKWISTFLVRHDIQHEMAHQADDRFTFKLELAIRFGKVLIVPDVERFTPSLLSVIVSGTHIRFNKRMLQVGNKLVDLHEDFKLVLVTTKSSLDGAIKSDIKVRITQIPFTITSLGFSDQLMSRSISLKMPELESRRISLLEHEGKLLEERAKLQNKLLEELSLASGDILKNGPLIASLNAVKESSDTIDKSLEESLTIREKLQDDYKKFASLSSKVADLYIGIGSTYHISSESYSTVYSKVLENEPNFDEARIFAKFIQQIYTILARQLSKSSYTELGLTVCKYAKPDLISDSKWESFITNFMGHNEASESEEVPPWIRSMDLTQKVMTLKVIHPTLFSALHLQDESKWREFMTSNAMQFPVVAAIDDFDKILITQILRPDLLFSVIRMTVSKLLGFNYMAIIQPTIAQISNESRPEKPVLIRSDPGTDLSRDLQEYVSEKQKGTTYLELSVTQGEEASTIHKMRNAMKVGQWVSLKNIHLIPHLVKDLEEELSGTSESVHSNFRLWIFCESFNGFSDSFILRSINILYELPTGLKLKVQRLLRMWEPALVSSSDVNFIKMSFILYLLTGLLQERRNFIPQGFTKWYDFGDSDLRVAMELIELLLSTRAQKGSSEFEWITVQGLLETVAFGGRINNVHDFNILVKHICDFFNKSVLSSSWSIKTLMRSQLKPVPHSTRLADYHKYLNENFSDTLNEPENFGLAKATTVAKDIAICRQLLKQLRHNYFQTNDHDNLEKRLRPLLSLWKSLRGKTTVLSTANSVITVNDQDITNPWTMFAEAELRLAGQLFELIQSTLVTLHSLPKSKLQRDPIMQQLCENQVPLEWRRLWNGPKVATNYIKSVASRAVVVERQYRNCIDAVPESIDLANMFNVDSFLATLKLVTAQRCTLNPYELVFVIRPHQTEDVKRPKDLMALTLAPLHIDGGLNFNAATGKLSKSNSKSEGINSPLAITPPMQLMLMTHGKDVESGDKDMDLNECVIPLYANSTREKHICDFRLAVDPHIIDLVAYSATALIVPELSQDHKGG